MAAVSKMYSRFREILKILNSTQQKRFATVSILALICWIIRMKTKKDKMVEIKGFKKGNKLGNVNKLFLQRMWKLFKIAIPSWKESVNLDILNETVFLVIRTILSIYISTVNGDIVKSVVDYNFSGFLKNIGSLLLLALPASFINSYLEYLKKIIALKMRNNMTKYFHKLYIKDKIYYQMTNIDSRIRNPDQRLTSDIEKWTTSFSQLYSNISKPLLDLILFSFRLSKFLSWRGPIFAIGWYGVAGVCMKFVTPGFGKLRAAEQILEGDFRSGHTDLIHYSEEISFLNGHNWERNRVNNIFNRLITHLKHILNKRLFMGTFDSLFVKYGATLSGYAILGIPVFGPNAAAYIRKIKENPSMITRDYIRNSSLLINMSKAMGRLAISYKEVQNVAGYTHLINQITEVLEDLEVGAFKRNTIENSQMNNFQHLTKGQFLEAKYIKFEDVPIIAPNGDVLVEKMSFEIKPKMNCIVSGPNGCGKSSAFRILGQLWPLWGGKLYRPKFDKLFYIPQRPYLPHGTLRHQIIYPHLEPQDGYTDEMIIALLAQVDLESIVEREGGLDSVNSWNDVFSGGEKQRMAIARLFYHRPDFAILDECTSNISLEDEHVLYSKAKSLNITLFTISHRASLFKFHDYYLKFDGEGGYSFTELTKKQQQGLVDDYDEEEEEE